MKKLLKCFIYCCFLFIRFCFRGICCNNNNEGVYLDRVIELQGELDELERQTNEVHQDQRRQINNQQAELREFRNTNTLVVVPTAPPVISGTSPVIAEI